MSIFSSGKILCFITYPKPSNEHSIPINSHNFITSYLDQLVISGIIKLVLFVSKYILSFIGFLPADDPELVLYVAIDNAKNVVQYGGTVSAPIAKNIFSSAIDIFNISPSKEVIPKEYTWLDTKYVILPDVVGMSKDEAKKALKGFNIEYSGSGETVVYQAPAAGMYVKEASTVTLMLN